MKITATLEYSRAGYFMFKIVTWTKQSRFKETEVLKFKKSGLFFPPKKLTNQRSENNKQTPEILGLLKRSTEHNSNERCG